MANLEELVIRIKADTAQLQSEMQKANTVVQNSTNKMSTGLNGLATSARALIPALSVAAFASFAKGAFEAADRLNDLSMRTGIAASTLSALNIPLLQGGSNVEEFASSITRMNNIIGEAAKGGNQALYDTFNKLGLSVKALMQLSPEEQFYAIAKALNQIKNQAEFTNTGIDIFGRSFATLAPLIRESNGNLQNFVDTAKKTGKAISEEDLKKIDEFGDKWTSVVEELKISMTVFTPVLEGLIEGFQILRALNPVNIGSEAGKALGHMITGLPEGASYKKPNVLTDEEAAKSVEQSLKKINAKSGVNPTNIAGDKSRAKAIDDAKKSLADYNKELERNQLMASKTAEQRAGDEVYYKYLDLAQKAGVKNAEQEAMARGKVAESIAKQKKEQEDAIRINDQWHDSLSSALTDAIMNFNSASDAAANLAKSIAQMIIQRSIAEPLTAALVGEKGTSGGGILGSLTSSFLGSFAVGADNIPRDGLAQIHKGEMIIPAMQAQEIRSGKNSNGGITLVQNNNFSAGVTRAEVSQMLPSVAKAAHDAVFASIQRGGSAAKIVGVR